MSIQWPNLGLFGEITKCEDGLLTLINKNFEILDAIVQLGITGFVADESALPSSPSSGDRYITQDDNNIWYFANGQWNEILSLEGFVAYNRATNSLISYDGTDWISGAGSAVNLGSGSQVFAQLNSSTGNLELRTLIGGTGITLVQTANDITINAEAQASNISTVTEDGDGIEVNFDLGQTPASEDSMLIWVNGVYQEQERWSFSGSTLTFLVAPPVGTNNIVVKIIGNVTVNTIADGSVTSAKLASNIDFANMPTQNSNPIVQSSSNANGSFIRYADGTQICTHVLTLNFNNTASLTSTWTYPNTFVSTPVATASLSSLSSTNTFTTRLGTHQVQPTSTNCVVNQFRINGQDNFVSGDTATVNINAIGRWF